VSFYRQTPETQRVPGMHRVPQAPQLALLMSVSTHAPEQKVCPPGQVQVPARQ
jgi:hypothetical protein